MSSYTVSYSAPPSRASVERQQQRARRELAERVEAFDKDLVSARRRVEDIEREVAEQQAVRSGDRAEVARLRQRLEVERRRGARGLARLRETHERYQADTRSREKQLQAMTQDLDRRLATEIEAARDDLRQTESRVCARIEDVAKAQQKDLDAMAKHVDAVEQLQASQHASLRADLGTLGEAVDALRAGLRTSNDRGLDTAQAILSQAEGCVADAARDGDKLAVEAQAAQAAAAIGQARALVAAGLEAKRLAPDAPAADGAAALGAAASAAAAAATLRSEVDRKRGEMLGAADGMRQLGDELRATAREDGVRQLFPAQACELVSAADVAVAVAERWSGLQGGWTRFDAERDVRLMEATRAVLAARDLATTVSGLAQLVAEREATVQRLVETVVVPAHGSHVERTEVGYANPADPTSARRVRVRSGREVTDLYVHLDDRIAVDSYGDVSAEGCADRAKRIVRALAECRPKVKVDATARGVPVDGAGAQQTADAPAPAWANLREELSRALAPFRGAGGKEG